MRIFKSRKFWATVAGILAIGATAISGEITWQDAVSKAVALLCTYIATIGVIDTAAIVKGDK